LGIERLNKKENSRQLASYHTKLLKDDFPINGVEAFATSIYNTTQLRWTFRTNHQPLLHTPLDYHIKLMKQQMNAENITKLHA
jgi:hypothetical protein